MSLVEMVLKNQKTLHLRGDNGFSLIEVNARNLLSKASFFIPSELLKQDSKQGENLTLTLDKDLQTVALKAMRREDKIGKRQGAVIVMKTNGEILSLVSEPGFDPS